MTSALPRAPSPLFRSNDTTKRRYLALWFPSLPTDREKVRSGPKPDELPLVLTLKDKGVMQLAAVDERARGLGLAPGMTLSTARALVPGLDVRAMDDAADVVLLQRAARIAESVTPLVAYDGNKGLILDVTGCAHLFGGEDGLLTLVTRRLVRLGLGTRHALAGTPDAAHALARFGRQGVVPPGDEEAFARTLPIAALEAGQEITTGLLRAGLRRLGDLTDRPSKALSARFGEALAVKLSCILGQQDRRITPLRPAPPASTERQCPEPLLHDGAIEAALEGLVLRLCAELEQRGEGGRRFEASFFRCDGQVRRLNVETSAPCREAKALLKLLRLRLDTLADPLDPGFGFDALRLSALATEPLIEKQADLEGSPDNSEEVSALIDRLTVRFGSERVLCFTGQDSHDPARSGFLAPLGQASSKPSPLVVEPDSAPERPLRLFSRPQLIEALAEVPHGPPLRFRWRRVLHEIARAEGPERIAPLWWLEPDAITRDYYRIEDGLGRRFWVFREGLYGEDIRPRWFIHGLFA